MTPHQKLIAAIDALIDQRRTDPLAAIPVVTTKEFFALIDLPDATNTRSADLVDLHPHGIAEYTGARRRLVAAGLRHGYPKTTAITLDSDPWTTY